MYLSGQNLALLQNSINFNDEAMQAKDGKEQKGLFAKADPKKLEEDSALFVQTKKDHRTSKLPSIKVEIGKNLSSLVTVSRSLGDMKSNFETIDRTLNIESEEEVTLPAERKQTIDENVDEIKTIINDTKIDDKKIFLSNMKFKLNFEPGQKEPYAAKIDFAQDVLSFDLDFENVENDLDKRFHQIREVNKSISKLDTLQEEVDGHMEVLKEQMDRHINIGKEATLYHLNSKLNDSHLVNTIKIKSSLFTDVRGLVQTQSNANAVSVLNLLP